MSRGSKQGDEPVREAARGDRQPFRRAFEPHRSELRAHCYRMLGCVHDSDDAVQEALFRAWRGLASFDLNRPVPPWLYKIATNVCLDMLADRARRILPFDLERGSDETSWLPQSTWITPYPGEYLPSASGYA
jgi:RNA polymerase sigma-70 factor, ECF subfamily